MEGEWLMSLPQSYKQKYMKGPTTDFKLITFPHFVPSLGGGGNKLFLVGSINPLASLAQGAWKKQQNSQICKAALSAKIRSANRQMVNIAGVLKPQLCASGSLRSMCVIIKISQII